MEAAVPSCVRCGAPLPIDPTARDVRCPSCGAEHRNDDALRARMLAYVGGHAAAAQAEVRARWIAVFHENNRRATVPVLVGAVGVSIAVVLWLGLSIAGEVSLPLVLASVAGSWLMLALLGLGFRMVFAMPRPEDLSRMSTVRCASCGGVSAFAAGAPAQACAFCGGRRVVPMRVAQAALDTSRREAKAAAMQEASAFDRAVRAGEPWVVPLVVVCILAVVIGAPALIAVEVLWLHSYWPIPALLGLVPLVFAVLVEIVWFGVIFSRTLRARDELERIVAGHAEREAASARAAELAPQAVAQPWATIGWTAFAEEPQGHVWLHDGALLLRWDFAGRTKPPATAMDFGPMAAILRRAVTTTQPLASLAWDAEKSAWIARGEVKLAPRYVEALRAIDGLELAPAGVHDPVLLRQRGETVGALMPLRQ